MQTPDLNLKGFQLGSEVVTFRIIEGKLAFGSTVTLAQWDEKWGVWRASNNSAIPTNGEGYMAMHKKEGKPHFYYSANPAHLAQAKAQRDKAMAERKAREAQDRSRFEELQRKFDELMAEYGAEVCASQTLGDDQGVEFEVYLTMGTLSKTLPSD